MDGGHPRTLESSLFFLINCWSSVASVVLPQLCNLHCLFLFVIGKSEGKAASLEEGKERKKKNASPFFGGRKKALKKKNISPLLSIRINFCFSESAK